MPDFQLTESALEKQLRRAQQRAKKENGHRVLDRAQQGDGLDPEDLNVLWFADLDTETLYEAARATRLGRPARLETFSPLYLTNTCDAECRMCGMRRDNEALTRETAALDQVEAQLGLLRRRGMRAVALLTGEYQSSKRSWAMRYVNEVLHLALGMQFAHVILNIGGIDDGEFDLLLAGVEREADGRVKPQITISNFQETYSRAHYAKFMGTDPENPRADFDRRLAGFDRAHRAGLRSANPGILLGLNRDLGWELTAFATHARHLRSRGMQVYLSVPRLRQIAGKHDQRGASDDEFVRLVSVLSLGLPDCKIVITTREPVSMQHKLVPIVTVLSAGSSAVAPYTDTSARYRIETSQFQVIDQRPFEEILREHLRPDSSIENFDVTPSPAAH
jgi:2-iminoacetate synthase ThiH